MKQLVQYIEEKLTIKKNSKVKVRYQPNNSEIKPLLQKLIKERGKDANLNDVDVSKVTDMCKLFKGLDIHNIDISEWNVSNVYDMESMFIGCHNFNCNLSNWDIHNVYDMDKMFYDCLKFTAEGLENWKINKDPLFGCHNMFYNCYSIDSSQKKKIYWYDKSL